MGALTRNNVRVTGVAGGPPVMFAHGFGCDLHMWRYVAPAFEPDHRVVLFDHVGAGGSDLAAFDADRYATLDGYAGDVLEICAELGCSDDVIAPTAVGEYVHRSIPGSRLVVPSATGHCPNLSAPDETVEAIRAFL